MITEDKLEEAMNEFDREYDEIENFILNHPSWIAETFFEAGEFGELLTKVLTKLTYKNDEYFSGIIAENKNLMALFNKINKKLKKGNEMEYEDFYDVGTKTDDDMVAVAGDIVVELQKRGWSIDSITENIIEANTLDIDLKCKG